MKQLKKKIIQNFFWCVILVAIIESVLNSIFDDKIIPVVKDNASMLTFVLALDFICSFGILLIFALIYCKLVSKKIDQETKRQLQERNLLYANIIHDLKTPMTSILGFARALKDNKVDETEKQQIFDIIYEKSKHTDALVNQLFNYTKLENEEYQLNLQKEDIGALLRDIIAESYLEFENRDMMISIEIPEEPIQFFVDRMEFRRAIQNIIVNAYKHNPEGTNVSISLTQLEQEIQIVIADSGVEIPTEQKSQIFHPFICGNESRTSRNGSGLGLAISNKVIEKHHGTLKIEDNYQGYTKAFIIRMKNTK